MRGASLLIGLLLCIWLWMTAETAFSFPLPTAKAAPQGKPEASTLEIGKPIERELAGGEAHTYRITLDSGQMMRAIIDQRGTDVVVAIYNPEEKKMMEVDRPNGVRGPETISIIADTAGHYRLVVRSSMAAPGRYQISIKELRPVAPQDETRIAAERSVTEGARLMGRETADSLRQAITQFDLALKLWRGLQERYEEAVALYGLGWSHNTLGEYQQAIHYFSQSSLLMQAEKSLEGAAQAEKGLAWAYLYTGEIEQARDFFSQSLQIDRMLGNIRGEGIALYGLGWAYFFAKDNLRALDHFSRSLQIRQATKDRRGEALALAGLARVYKRLDEKKSEAIGVLKRALELLRETGDQNGEADILSNLGWVYYSLRQDEQALDYFKQALQLCHKIGDRPAEATTRYGIAALAERKGQIREACQ